MTSETPPEPESGPEPETGPPPLSPPDQRVWSVIAHLGGVVTNVIVPLIVYVLLRNRGAFVRVHAANALNFQLTVLIAYALGFVLSIALVGIFIAIAAAVLNVVFSIIGAVKAGQGEPYEYPFGFRFVS